MKKILAFSLVLFLSVALLAACDNGDPESTQESQTTEPQTEIIENLIPVEVPYSYSVTDGKVSIIRYTGSEESVTIPERIGEYPVVELGQMAFAKNQTLKSVEIPGTLADTGEFTFYDCPNLTTVTLHEGTQSIGYGCFNNCTALSEIVFPESLTTVYHAAFKGCTGLKAIDLNKVTLIEDAAFCASGLVSVVVPEGTKVEEEAFMECTDLVKVEWNAGGNIREKTFAYCYSLKDVTLCENVTRIYDECFTRCTSLETITFPVNVQRYYSHALYGCTSLKSITFNNPGIDRFYEMAFHFMPSLTDIYFAGSEAQWNAMDKGVNNDCLTAKTVTVHFGA